MTAQEHMENLAQRYARALLRWHMTGDREDFGIVVDLQNMLDMVCREVADEMLEETL